MKLHYFDDDRADPDDSLLQACINQRYVPRGCLLNGAVVLHEIRQGRTPCAGCEGPRQKCGGSPKTDDPNGSPARVTEGNRQSAAAEPPRRPAAPEGEIHYFLGVDPAPAQSKKSDTGGMATLRATPRVERPGVNLSDWLPEFVWADTVRGHGIREWSGRVHEVHEWFGLSGIMLDPGAGGGGTFLWPELGKSRQLIQGVEREVTPIATIHDTTVGAGAHHILTLFLRTELDELWPKQSMRGDDVLKQNGHLALQSAIHHVQVCLPIPWGHRAPEEREIIETTWSPARIEALKALSLGIEQMLAIQVATKADGAWELTRNSACQFITSEKDDVAMAMMLAWVRFLLWLHTGDHLTRLASEDEAQCAVLVNAE